MRFFQLQIEFKLMNPSAHDLCMNFQKKLPGILALQGETPIETPIEDGQCFRIGKTKNVTI